MTQSALCKSEISQRITAARKVQVCNYTCQKIIKWVKKKCHQCFIILFCHRFGANSCLRVHPPAQSNLLTAVPSPLLRPARLLRATGQPGVAGWSRSSGARGRLPAARRAEVSLWDHPDCGSSETCRQQVSVSGDDGWASPHFRTVWGQNVRSVILNLLSVEEKKEIFEQKLFVFVGPKGRRRGKIQEPKPEPQGTTVFIYSASKKNHIILANFLPFLVM